MALSMSSAPSTTRVRYRFGELMLSPGERSLRRGGQEVALIPRYFDLLVLLVARRGEAVHRQVIFDVVWDDVIVSDSALTQAVRTLRRALDDDPKEPRFIRTVSRHGYRFVFPEVVEEPDVPAPASAPPVAPPPANAPSDRVEAAIETLLGVAGDPDEEAANDAAELLHQTGTAAALARIDARPGHERARAYLRDRRWDVPGAGEVPLLGSPGGPRTLAILFGLRLRHARRLVEERWLSASLGGGIAGLLAGAAGGTVLWLGPGARATSTVPVVLGLLGMIVASVGAAGVGAGMAMAEALVRSWRRLSLTLFAAAGGGAVAGMAHLLGQWTLRGLFGRDLAPLSGAFEGLIIGGAAGLGYALSTPRAEGGMATPRGQQRLRVALVTGLAASLAAFSLAAHGSYLGAMSIDFMARSFPGSQMRLDPLARCLGEATPGIVTRLAISAGEGMVFGFGLAWGLTRRPR
jgi:DNA-binding winged helix-turn-helix (wHTH) protein